MCLKTMCNFRTSKLLLNCAVPEEGGPPALTCPGGSTGMVLAPGTAPGAHGSGPELGAAGRQPQPHQNGGGGRDGRARHHSLSAGEGLWGWQGLGDSPLLTPGTGSLQHPSITHPAFSSSPGQGLLLLVPRPRV